MATVRGSSLTRPVLLACLVLALYGVVCCAGVAQHESHRPSLHRPSSGGGALQVDGRHSKDVSESSSADHWKLLARRLNAVLRMMRSKHASNDAPPPAIEQNRVLRALHGGVRRRRDVSASSSAGHWKLLTRRLNAVLRTMRSRKTAHASNDALSSDMKPKRVRRSYTQADKVAQQQEVAREIEQIERDAGVPSDAEKLEQEEEIVREIKQVEAQYGPAHKIAQQKEIAREIEEAEIQAGRAVADREFEQQREIQREIEEIERKVGIPSDAEKLEQEREIAREIEEIEAQARARQVAQERKVAADMHAIIDAHFGRKGRPDSSSSDATSSTEESQESQESEESQESSDVTNDGTDNVDDSFSSSEESQESQDSEESQESSDVTNDGTDDVDDDPYYGDSFGDDSSSDVSPLDENDDDDIISPDDEPSSPGAAAVATEDATAGARGQVKDAAPGQGHSQVAHSSWQVTAMTVVMCSIVGVVLLIVVGAWYRHLGPFRPGQPGHLLLEDDEQAVYNRTTQPGPRQVGLYSPLK